MSVNTENPCCFLDASHVRKVTLCNYNYSHEGIYHPDRIMSEYDMLYLTSGSWDIYEDDIPYHLEAGSLLLLEPGKHHYSLEKCSPEMRNVFLHLSVCPGDMKESDCGLCIRKITDCNSHPEIYGYFERIIDLFRSETADIKEYRIETLLSRLLITLNDMSGPENTSQDPVISDILYRFRSNPERFFSPESLARDYGVSLRTMSSHFKSVTGTTIHRYQLNQKLEMAYEALSQNPSRSIRDIAISYGFYDEFHFSKLFKRKYGISPSRL